MQVQNVPSSSVEDAINVVLGRALTCLALHRQTRLLTSRKIVVIFLIIVVLIFRRATNVTKCPNASLRWICRRASGLGRIATTCITCRGDGLWLRHVDVVVVRVMA